MISNEDLEELKELSKENYLGDMPFTYYGNLIGRLIGSYNQLEKERDYYKARYNEFNEAFIKMKS